MANYQKKYLKYKKKYLAAKKKYGVLGGGVPWHTQANAEFAHKIYVMRVLDEDLKRRELEEKNFIPTPDELAEAKRKTEAADKVFPKVKDFNKGGKFYEIWTLPSNERRNAYHKEMRRQAKDGGLWATLPGATPGSSTWPDQAFYPGGEHLLVDNRYKPELGHPPPPPITWDKPTPAPKLEYFQDGEKYSVDNIKNTLEEEARRREEEAHRREEEANNKRWRENPARAMVEDMWNYASGITPSVKTIE